MNRISAPGTAISLTLETQAAAQQERVGTEMGSEVPLFSKLPAGSSGWKIISRLLSPLTKTEHQEGREDRAGASREQRRVMGTEDCARLTPQGRAPGIINREKVLGRLETETLGKDSPKCF